MSVDPYMRGRMNDVKSYIPPFQLDEPMQGGAVGEVVASAAEGFAVGDHVLHHLGWREYAELDAKFATKVDASLAPLSAYLGVLGMPGLTAYSRPLRGRLLQGGRLRLRLRRGRCGRQPRRPVRQDQGRLAGDRLGQARTRR